MGFTQIFSIRINTNESQRIIVENEDGSQEIIDSRCIITDLKKQVLEFENDDELLEEIQNHFDELDKGYTEILREDLESFISDLDKDYDFVEGIKNMLEEYPDIDYFYYYVY